MKKALLMLAASVAAIGSSYAQGYVFFSNQTATTPVKVNTSAAQSTFTATANTATPSYYFALFYSTSSSVVNGSSTAVVGTPNFSSPLVTGDGNWAQDPGVTGINNASGRNGGGFADANTAAANTGTYVPAGSGQDHFVVLGWSQTLAAPSRASRPF